MDKKWSIIKNEDDNLLYVTEDENGIYSTKEAALANARQQAIMDKTFLKVNNEAEPDTYEITNYTSALSQAEWNAKLKSEFKIAKAEYMISRTREKSIKQAIRKARMTRDYEKEAKLKIRLNETVLKKRKNEINLKEAKIRLKESNRINKRKAKI